MNQFYRKNGSKQNFCAWAKLSVRPVRSWPLMEIANKTPASKMTRVRDLFKTNFVEKKLKYSLRRAHIPWLFI